MNIEYNVPLPIKDGSKKIKFQKEYEKIFYFYHSGQKLIELEVESAVNFIRCVPYSIKRYKGKLRCYMDGYTKVMVVRL